MAVTALDLPACAWPFPRAKQRVANLEALPRTCPPIRGALQNPPYPASPTGLLTWLQRLHGDQKDVDVAGLGDYP